MAQPELMTVTISSIPHAHMTYMYRRKQPSTRATACRRVSLVLLGVFLVFSLFAWLAFSAGEDDAIMAN